jgi:transcription elongation factor Elf1
MSTQAFTKTFTCKGCGHEVPLEYSLKTKDYCYLCDPKISIDELIDGPIRIKIDSSESPLKKLM